MQAFEILSTLCSIAAGSLPSVAMRFSEFRYFRRSSGSDCGLAGIVPRHERVTSLPLASFEPARART